MDLDPMDRPPAGLQPPTRASDPLPGAFERVMFAVGGLVLLAFAAVQVLDLAPALGGTLLVAPVVFLVLMRNHLSPRVVSSAVGIGLPLAVLAIWLT